MTKSPVDVIEDVQGFLQHSVCDVFNTMLSLEASPSASPEFQAENEPVVAGSVGFAGDVNGVVYLHVKATFARTLASRLLGMSEAELNDDAMVNDAVGEISNMVVGSVKSRLCDAGHACVLTIPSIVRGQNFKLDAAGTHERRLLGFRCGGEQLVIELVMKGKSAPSAAAQKR